nr:MAG TPA: hypothetical protein [Caudoviricetes sp.]
MIQWMMNEKRKEKLHFSRKENHNEEKLCCYWKSHLSDWGRHETHDLHIHG